MSPRVDPYNVLVSVLGLAGDHVEYVFVTNNPRESDQQYHALDDLSLSSRFSKPEGKCWVSHHLCFMLLIHYRMYWTQICC